MRNPAEIKERVTMLLIEEINRVGFDNLTVEPENLMPKFIEDLSDKVTELILDEISYGRHG